MLLHPSRLVLMQPLISHLLNLQGRNRTSDHLKPPLSTINRSSLRRSNMALMLRRPHHEDFLRILALMIFPILCIMPEILTS